VEEKSRSPCAIGQDICAKRGRWREGGREEKRSHARRNLYDLDTAIDAAVDV